ncbi:MAG: Hsp20/alpha crystallin family protein [Acidobacteria bacterium]|nr:Hsp20/alpha crystallin family protein [Acidobacteriota bacterium]
MAAPKWDPFRDLLALKERMNRLFEDAIARFRFSGEGGDADLWSPPVDIYETDHEIVLVAELPGLRKGEIDVQVVDNELTIQGERRLEKDLHEENYHRIERSYGRFRRNFTLPVGVRKDRISATYDRGVLRVSLPKAETTGGVNLRVPVD